MVWFFLPFPMLIHYCHLFQIIVCTITLWQWEPPLRTAPPLTNITACVASPCTEAAALHRRGETLYWDTHPRRTIIGSVQPKKGRYLVKWLGLDSFYTTTSVKTICSFYWTKLFLKIFSAAAPSAAASHPIGLMDATATLLMRKILKLIHFNLNSS